MTSPALHEMNTVMDLSFLGLLKVEGDGAKQLLQGQLTCNLDEMHEFSRLAAHCNPQGRIISLSRLFFYQNAYYLQLPAEMLGSAQAALQKYAVFFKVKITDATHELGRLSVSGNSSMEKLTQILTKLPTVIDEIIESNAISIIKLPGLTPHYELIGEIALIDDIHEKLKTKVFPLPNEAEQHWKYLNILSGIPSIYTQTETKLLPHEINLQQINAVSFNKGCYTGQEIIARMHYRGQLKKHMYYATVNSAKLPAPGDNIYDTEPRGIIIDSCQSTETLCHLLFVATETDIQTKTLYSDTEKQQSLEFLNLPYT